MENSHVRCWGSTQEGRRDSAVVGHSGKKKRAETDVSRRSPQKQEEKGGRDWPLHLGHSTLQLQAPLASVMYMSVGKDSGGWVGGQDGNNMSRLL